MSQIPPRVTGLYPMIKPTGFPGGCLKEETELEGIFCLVPAGGDRESAGGLRAEPPRQTVESGSRCPRGPQGLISPERTFHEKTSDV